MKNRLKQVFLVMTIATLGIFMSCGKDDGITIDPSLELEFSTTGASVSESDAAVTVTLTFPAAPTAVSVTADVTGTATYTDDYTTDPAVSSGSISISVAKDATSASFTLTPVDNVDADGSRTVIFTLASAEGISLGTNTTYTVTITDDDTAPTTIGSIRTTYESGTYDLAANTLIRGVVTSDKANITGSELYLQDATGGINVKFAENNASFELGNELIIDVSGLTVDDDNGPQIQGIALSAVNNLGAGTMPTPVEITVTQANTGDYDGQLVTLTDVAMEEGGDTYSSFTTYGIADATGESIGTFVRSFTSTIPVGIGTVTGIATAFGSTPQLILRTEADVDVSEIAAIGVTASVTDFGSVDNGITSSSLSFVVTVTSGALSGDVTVTASDNFVLTPYSSPSRTEVEAYTSSTTIPMADLAAGSVTVFGYFQPSTGFDGAINGTFSFSSFGVASQTTAVTGTEAGNGSVGTTETFTGSNLPTGYSNSTYTGVNGIVWTYVASRDDGGYEIDGDGIMLRRSDEPSSISASIDDGIGNFSVQLMKAFTGAGDRQVEIFVNGNSVGTSITFDEDGVPNTLTIDNINVSGTFTLEIRNISAKQLTVDNINWTGFSG